MSHDETSGPVTRKERRAAYGGKRQAAPRYVFMASDYLRPDFTTAMLIEFLEAKARGYNGHLRALLCTSAAALRDQQAALRRYEANIEALQDAAAFMDPVLVDEMRARANSTPREACDG